MFHHFSRLHGICASYFSSESHRRHERSTPRFWWLVILGLAWLSFMAGIFLPTPHPGQHVRSRALRIWYVAFASRCRNLSQFSRSF